MTGRILSDLKREAGDLQFVDAVVAEDGAVLAFPNGHSWFFTGMRVAEISRDGLRKCSKIILSPRRVRKVKQRYRLGYVASLRGELVKAIRERYEVESGLVLLGST